jgi:hypothetical protein
METNQGDELEVIEDEKATTARIEVEAVAAAGRHQRGSVASVPSPAAG